MHPIATIKLQSGEKIQVEIDPLSAPNAAASFIWLANQGAYNKRSIQRIVPDFVIQPSYNSFEKDPVCDFLIANESRINGYESKSHIPLTRYAVAMGGMARHSLQVAASLLSSAMCRGSRGNTLALAASYRALRR